MREYWIESSVQRHRNSEGRLFWVGTCHLATATDQHIRSEVRPYEQIAVLSSRGRVDIGEPWPDPTTPVGLSRLLAIAEGLAVTEWERRFGGTSDNPR